MFSYKFFIREDKNNSLWVRLINNRKKVDISMGIQMSTETLADAMSQRPRPENIKWRSVLNFYQMKLDGIKCVLIQESKTDLDVKEIKGMVLSEVLGRNDAEDSSGQETPTVNGVFIEWFNKFIEKKSNKGTKGVYKHTLDKIRTFDSDINSKGFEDIDFGWLSDFEAFCAKTASKNARNIHLRNIRAVFNNAIDNEITTTYPFRRFKIRPEATEKRSMTVEELREVISYPVEPYAEIYRDMFALIFMLIGINTVDLHRLERVEHGRIKFRRAKTGRLYSIKVEPEAQAIIDKYRGEKGLLRIADRWSDHRNFRHQLNKALQRMGEVERKGRGGKKIIEPAFPGLTSYWARHTWATIAAELDVPDAVISQALGHSGDTNSTTAIYIKRNEKKVDEANRKVLDWVLHGKR